MTFKTIQTKLNLDTPQKKNTFLELYGYWLGDGSLGFTRTNGGKDSISFLPTKDVDKIWLDERLNILNLNDLKQYECKAGKLYYIQDPEWVDLFHTEYASKYQGGENSGPKSAKWLMDWVWKLNKEEVRLLFKGLRMADGNEARNKNSIYTSSVAFRDQLVRLAFHGGYSPHFMLKFKKGSHRGTRNGLDIIARHDNWHISYNESVQHAEPNLCMKRDVRKVEYSGKTWCVNVPHHFVIARRAHYDGDLGYITKASTPIITGNCHAGMNRSASVICAYLILVGKMSYKKAVGLLEKANSTRGLDVLTNPSFRKALKELEKNRDYIQI